MGRRELLLRTTLAAAVATSALMLIEAAGPPARAAGARTPVHHSFDAGIQGWYSYDYEGGTGTLHNVFYPARWDPSGFVSADDSGWRIDTPESPDSVLALLRYQQWMPDGDSVRTSEAHPIDLRGAAVRFRLRGRDLDLAGGHATFWIHSQVHRARFHLRIPIAVTSDWSEVSMVLPDDPRVWHRSWALDPKHPPALSDVLAAANSYGIGFVGFDREPTGTLDLDDFGISPD